MSTFTTADLCTQEVGKKIDDSVNIPKPCYMVEF